VPRGARCEQRQRRSTDAGRLQQRREPGVPADRTVITHGAPVAARRSPALVRHRVTLAMWAARSPAVHRRPHARPTGVAWQSSRDRSRLSRSRRVRGRNLDHCSAGRGPGSGRRRWQAERALGLVGPEISGCWAVFDMPEHVSEGVHARGSAATARPGPARSPPPACACRTRRSAPRSVRGRVATARIRAGSSPSRARRRRSQGLWSRPCHMAANVVLAHAVHTQRLEEPVNLAGKDRRRRRPPAPRRPVPARPPASLQDSTG
jgi:hypothetical protein